MMLVSEVVDTTNVMTFDLSVCSFRSTLSLIKRTRSLGAELESREPVEVVERMSSALQCCCSKIWHDGHG